MKPVLIVKTGSAIEGIPKQWGDFEHWIAEVSGLQEGYWQSCAVFDGEELPAFDSFSGIIITGSAAMVTQRHRWSESTAAWLKVAVKASIPTLGICYGHQLLAHALGGQVIFHPGGREIGTTEIVHTEAAQADRLFSRLPGRYQAHVSHSQTVGKLPPDAVILAASNFEAHHAVRFAENAWGVQFHPEFSSQVIAQYLQLRSKQIMAEGIDVEALLAGVTETPEAAALLKKFVALCTQ